MEVMNWSTWRRHFEENAKRPYPPIDAPELSEEHRRRVAQSLASFQLGEAGEGRIGHDIDMVSLPGIDDDYRVALKRFVAEEGRHARLLGLMVNALGGELLRRQWTESAFVWVRRAFGVRFKLLVLMAAEVIGIAFYGVLAHALPRGSMRAALEEICDDEEHHLDFHVDFFRSQRGQGIGAAALWLLWWPVGVSAAAIVLFDHRATLRALGLPESRLVRAMWARMKQGAEFFGLDQESPTQG